MVDKKEKEMRKVMGDTLLEIMKENKDIVVMDADLASSSGLKSVFDKYPSQSVNAGISEQNMIASAAGMSLVGLKPIVHSFSPFVTRRVLDQVYTSLAYGRNSTFIYASDPGYWSMYNGGTHTTFEDLAMMRTIPTMVVFAPSDPTTLAWGLKFYSKHGGAIYCRTPRGVMMQLYRDNEQFEFGEFKIIHEGSKVLFIGVGDTVADIWLKVVPSMQEKKINPTVVDLLFVKPLNEDKLAELLAEYEYVITVENHNKYGGIGDLTASIIAERGISCKFLKIAVNDRFGEVGEKQYLKETLGLDEASIISKTLKFLEKKEC